MESLVHAIFADVNILVFITLGSALTECEMIKHTAVAHDRVKRNNLIEGRLENLAQIKGISSILAVSALTMYRQQQF